MSSLRDLLAVGLVGSLVSLLALAGCAPTEADSDATSVREEMLRKSNGDGSTPDGAISLSGGLYAVPVVVDDQGCEQFAEWSAGGVARQIIYFRDGDGGFSAVKSEEHSCNAAMVQIGEDDRGCSIYRAEQPDGSVTDAVYYRSASGYTVNPETANCGG